VLIERAEKKGIPPVQTVLHYSLDVCAKEREWTSKEIVQKYVMVKDEEDRFYAKGNKQTGKERERDHYSES
jgi:hypothetical protein